MSTTVESSADTTGTTVDPSRRSVLGACGAGGVGVMCAALLAACGGTSSSGAASTGTDSSSSGSAAGTVLIALDKVPVGGAASATLAGAPVIVARPDDKTVKAFSAACTHLGTTVIPSGAVLNCPSHGSQFNALTGAAIHGPATNPLPKIGVAIKGTDIVTA